MAKNTIPALKELKILYVVLIIFVIKLIMQVPYCIFKLGNKNSNVHWKTGIDVHLWTKTLYSSQTIVF